MRNGDDGMRQKIKYEIEKDKRGFCVWVIENGEKHWIIDGSSIIEDNIFRVSHNKYWQIRAFEEKNTENFHFRDFVIRRVKHAEKTKKK